MKTLVDWEFDPEYYFDYEELDDEEKYRFQAMEEGAYDISIQRVHAALYVLAQKGVLKCDVDWWPCSHGNKIGIHRPTDGERDQLIIAMCYEQHVEVFNETTTNEIVVHLKKNNFVEDTEKIAEAIMIV